MWSALLGLGLGLVTMVFTITFRRARAFSIHAKMPHTMKLIIGGLLTGICGLAFSTIYPGTLIPLGPNYEAVRQVLTVPHHSGELVNFRLPETLRDAFLARERRRKRDVRAAFPVGRRPG